MHWQYLMKEELMCTNLIGLEQTSLGAPECNIILSLLFMQALAGFITPQLCNSCQQKATTNKSLSFNNLVFCYAKIFDAPV